jgi:hypothetical protein
VSATECRRQCVRRAIARKKCGYALSGLATCCGGGGPSSASQIGAISDPLSFNHQPRQQILARNTIWHQTAADDAANPDGEYQPWRGTAAFRSSTRCTRHIQPAKAKLPD